VEKFQKQVEENEIKNKKENRSIRKATDW